MSGIVDEKYGMKKLSVLDGLKDGFPVFLGYFPIAMAFGILSKGTGLTFDETIGFSLVVFAGAAQFIGVSMIGLGASAMEIVIATFFLNFRHFLMSASLASRMEINNNIFKPLISYMVTDESFSVASFAKGKLTGEYTLVMQLTGYFGWALGTGVGYVVGSILPPLLQVSMGIGLYAMFVALIMPEVKKSKKALVLALLAGLVNTVVKNFLALSDGWCIVIAIVVVSFVGVLVIDDEENDLEGNKKINEQDGKTVVNESESMTGVSEVADYE